MRVIDIVIEHDRLGYFPDQIIDLHPHLSLEQVHDALSYYYANRDALDQEIELRKNRIEAIGKKYPRKIMWLESDNQVKSYHCIQRNQKNILQRLAMSFGLRSK